MQEKTIEVLKHQRAFLNSEFRHTGLIGGFGSGKTFAGVLKTVKKKIELKGIDVAYYLPTYSLIKDIAFSEFSNILNLFQIPYTLNRTDKEFQTPYGRIIMRTMDNPDLIVGYEVGYSLIDEADVLPKEKMRDVFSKVLSRNRKKLPDGKINQLDFVSTPEGFKFLYDFFVLNKSEQKHLIKGKTYDNPFLPDDYVLALEDEYTPQQIEAYLNGEFVNLTSGTVYIEFDRKLNHSDVVAEPNEVIHIGMDFNITKMNAVAHVVRNGLKYAVSEFINEYDTFSLASKIRKVYENHKVVIYPDASGNARNTSGKSDHQILRDFKFTIVAPSKNPFVRDRVNSVNRNFRDKTYFVNTYNCPTYSEALERQTYKNGEPDKQSGFDHVTEAGGYFVINSDKKISYKIT